MKKSIRYAAHLGPIDLSFTSDFPREEAAVSLLPVVSVSAPAEVVGCHQKFIIQQTEIFHFFLKKQKELLALTLPPLREEEQPSDMLPGPAFSRADLEGLASDRISDYFGEWFIPLDQHARLVRMPQPPLLLADRVTGIDAVPGSLTTGTIWTETDVVEDAWYIHAGRMPAGIMIEAGQADLLLASWLGFDFYNQGTRVYRLLGCELSYRGELPRPGDTLCYDIHIDGQAKQGNIRLFFFHYDCRVNGELRLQVRNGQAGFFSDQELAESGGVLWDASTAECDHTLPLDPPRLVPQQNRFTRQQIEQFALGQLKNCFGPGFEWAASHTRTPCISHGKMLFLHEISDFNIKGGPWQRGYMRAIQKICPDDWFFQGHFKNDPCMPGTLMLEAGLQVMAFYLTALGYTLDKDGWRFEPVTEKNYKLSCRGQVRPHAKEIVYEIFVSSVVSSPVPMLFADLLGTVDGLKAFHTKIGLRLIADWPLKHLPQANNNSLSPVANYQGFKFDYNSLLACALGKPSSAFGPLYQIFDNHRRVPRLPGPPYHFMSRVIEAPEEMAVLAVGSKMRCEYEVPPGAWYFLKDNAEMPYCVLLEAALQPCGWLASYMGSVLTTIEDLVFRNLDGTGTVHRPVLSTAGLLSTRVTCTGISRSAGMLIESFSVETQVNNETVFTMDTTFGFFPQSAFDNQPGLPTSAEESSVLVKISDCEVDLRACPHPYFEGLFALPEAPLLMLDRVTGFWPQGGEKGQGQLRAEKTVDPSEWFFKAHFFQDPVQPGSLGLEAMYQLLHFYVLQKNLPGPRAQFIIERPALQVPLTWKYRGQVTPINKKIQVTLDIIEEKVEGNSIMIKANSSLWVDNKRIYQAKNLGVYVKH